MEIEKIVAKASKLSKKDIEKINQEFDAYLFYENTGNGRKYTCTNCHKTFEVSYSKKGMSNTDCFLLDAQHNEECYCPKCHRRATVKNKGKARRCVNLGSFRRVMVVKRVSYNKIYLVYIYATKDYSVFGYNTDPICDVGAVYIIEPGKAQGYQKNGYFHNWTKMTSIKEPYTKTWYYNSLPCDLRGYSIINFDNLEKSFLKYIDFEELSERFASYQNNSYWYEIPFAKMVSNAAIYPISEFVIKSDFWKFFFELCEGKPNKRIVNWQAKSPKDYLKKITTDQVKGLLSAEITEPDDIKYFLSLKKKNYKISAEQFSEFINQASKSTMYKLLNQAVELNVSTTKILNYINKNHETYQKLNALYHLSDYWRMASELNYDLRRSDVIFPKDFKAAHDNAVDNVNTLREEERIKRQKEMYKVKEKGYKERKKKLEKMYSYDNGKFCILIPEGVEDIVREGSELKHCVGGYAARHCQGKTTIVFMRRSDDKSKRLVTIEIKDDTKEIMQNYGYKDRLVTEEEQEFINEWHGFVEEKSKNKNVA